jgi:hypothetical protein
VPLPAPLRERAKDHLVAANVEPAAG